MNKLSFKIILFIAVLLVVVSLAKAQKVTVTSPNKQIQMALFPRNNSNVGAWYLKGIYNDNGKAYDAIPDIELGLLRNDQDFHQQLKFLKAGKPTLIKEDYTVLHGKRSHCTNQANEVILYFENPSKAKINVIVRTYNDGIVFRYAFPEKGGSYQVKEEHTSYMIDQETTRWMEKWNPANEGLYTEMSGEKVQQSDWGYPALFNLSKSNCWFLLHEADLASTYCGSKLSNKADKFKYKITFPDAGDGRGTGEVEPKITLPWKSPWRVITMGKLGDIVKSTLIDDVSPPSTLKNTSWIKPGLVSWNYWSSNHGTKDYQIVTKFADLAARMNWPYTLLDWEWDSMSNGGDVEKAAKYILSQGVKPLIWYNSGGNHTWVSSTPKDRMLTHENRVVEFGRLKKMGFVGVKIDFFESEKQNMIKYYLDILEDAAKFQMMVYFHGCLVPRGWSRTYPNLMTYEAVRGAEWYNNGPEFTLTAPQHNAILPFTRNVVGPMDYTPVTFTNSQFPHTTSYGHELALSVLFESGLQHFADRPEGYDALPDEVTNFLRNVPAAWDETQLIDGYPGKDVILARRKSNNWYMAGINAENREKQKELKFEFLPEGVKYKLTLIADGKHDTDFAVQHILVDKNSIAEVRMLRRGGFASTLTPLP
jgi:alpha-glucosidase